MSIIQSIFLSVVQGITEFLPISSSGHLILIPKFFHWPDQGLAFDAVVHLGTALAAMVYFRSYIFDVIKGFLPNKLLNEKGVNISMVAQKSSRRFSYIVLLSTIPAVIVGLTFKSVISDNLRIVAFVALNLLAWGIVLIFAEIYANKPKKEIKLHDLTYKKGLIIGLAQAIALFPGTSRSGITISAALFCDMNRQDAVRFSFLMSIPVILGAGLISLLELIIAANGEFQAMPVIIGLLGAFLSGILAIHFLLKLVDKKGLLYFGIYRIILALILLGFFI